MNAWLAAETLSGPPSYLATEGLIKHNNYLDNADSRRHLRSAMRCKGR